MVIFIIFVSYYIKYIRGIRSFPLLPTIGPNDQILVWLHSVICTMMYFKEASVLYVFLTLDMDTW